MNYKEETIQTYDDSAQELADYFRGIGPRIDDIELALTLAGDHQFNANVVEIGCGDGRDAAEITKRVGRYWGVDPSAGLLAIARNTLPEVDFIKSDALSYNYPENLDVVFAFASLLHVNRTDFAIVCQKVAKALRKGGIFLVSLKEKENYTEVLKEDKYGRRMFYFYTAKLVEELAGDIFANVFESHQKVGDSDWFTLALERK